MGFASFTLYFTLIVSPFRERNSVLDTAIVKEIAGFSINAKSLMESRISLANKLFTRKENFSLT